LNPSAGARAPTFGVVGFVPTAWAKAIETEATSREHAAKNFSFKRDLLGFEYVCNGENVPVGRSDNRIVTAYTKKEGGSMSRPLSSQSLFR
jgi:hypothetical protein